MVALIIEHLFSIRRGRLVPHQLAEEVHQLISQGQLQPAEEACRDRNSLLAYLLASGLTEMGQGYSAVEKAMEDASLEQSARLYRKIEWLSVIGNVAPMVGLFGTVWGMILAFREFESKANPQVSELAPGIYEALVTTLMGLAVAVPAFLFFAFFRNRVDELVAQASLMAEHVFGDFKRAMAARRKAERKARAEQSSPGEPSPGIASVPVRREKTG
jgi:biopolymer transport protein ExbB